jgi:hypothetical protein
MRHIAVEMTREAHESYEILKRSQDKSDRQLLKAIERTIDILERDHQFGDPIPKRLIPKGYLTMGVNNLWRVELPGFWRLLYTIRGDKLEVVAFILEWMDHRRYDKLFDYRKK